MTPVTVFGNSSEILILFYSSLDRHITNLKEGNQYYLHNLLPSHSVNLRLQTGSLKKLNSS